MGETVTGVLSVENKKTFIKGPSGQNYLKNEHIWDGYVAHWENQTVHARRLLQKDYDTGKHIYLLWPKKEQKSVPFFELYYNERLVKYTASSLGHNAINIGGDIFNFSHLMNENEVITPEEYFYRPALGEFAPSPTTGRFALNINGRNYFDKFGRNFMRTIHVLRVEGINEASLSNIFNEELKVIHNTDPHPKSPEKYKDFNFFHRSCATILRDGLRKYGLKKIKGVFPLDFFASAATICSGIQELKSTLFTMPQLLVKEAPPSVTIPFMNPCNYYQFRKLRYQNQ